MKQFTKDMLETGMRVVLRNGLKYIVIGETLRNTYGHMRLKDYDENLLCVAGMLSDKYWDIMDVYKDCVYNSNENSLGELLWEREEFTEEQKQIQELKETIKKAQEQIEQLERNVK